jgi:hypothetical protein
VVQPGRRRGESARLQRDSGAVVRHDDAANFTARRWRARSELDCRGGRGAGARPAFIGREREREGRRGGETVGHGQ